MNLSTVYPRLLSRRAALRSLAWSGVFLGHAAQAQNGNAAAATGINTKLTPLAQSWRAMSRVGYGASSELVRVLQSAPSAQVWAVRQIELAYAASQTPPHISPDLSEFNAALPRLFVKVQRERQARKTAKAELQKVSESPAPRPMDFSAAFEPENFSRIVVQQTAAWRLTSCSQPQTENPLLARMTEFWFNHLNVYVGKGAVRPFIGHYLVNVIRRHAMGKYEDLLLASARHPAMLLYLDQARSVADGSRGAQGSTRGLNENYARELLELHTLGVKGGYSQTDVRELARVLTGWTVSDDDESGFRFTSHLHDKGVKQVLGRKFSPGLLESGEQEGVEAIRLLARHPSTAKRIALRLAQFFVADAPSAELVNRLATVYLKQEGDIRAVLRALLESPDFWHADNRLFKTPMDYACSVLTATQGATQAASPDAPDRRNLVLTMSFLASAGQPLHGWQTPDGYPFDAATWLAPEALTRRADFAVALGRNQPDVDFLLQFLNSETKESIAQEAQNMRAGLILASPDLMYK